jgi:co-chaperonin GroES (HSP10)
MSKSSIQAQADVVIIVRPEAKTESAKGIVLPDAAVKEPHYGKVVSIGPEVKDQDLLGKIVIFDVRCGVRVQISDDDSSDLWWIPDQGLILSMPVGEAKNLGLSIPKETMETLLREACLS